MLGSAKENAAHAWLPLLLIQNEDSMPLHDTHPYRFQPVVTSWFVPQFCITGHVCVSFVDTCTSRIFVHANYMHRHLTFCCKGIEEVRADQYATVFKALGCTAV